MHACRFELLLDPIMLTIFWKNQADPFISMLKTKMLLEYDDSFDARRSTELSIIQVIDFSFWVNCGVSPCSTHMYIRALSKVYEGIEPLSFYRVIALLRTDGDHELKLALTRLFALSPVAVSRIWCFGPSQSIHCI